MGFYSEGTRQFDYSYLISDLGEIFTCIFVDPFCEVNSGSRCLFKINVTAGICNRYSLNGDTHSSDSKLQFRDKLRFANSKSYFTDLGDNSRN